MAQLTVRCCDTDPGWLGAVMNCTWNVPEAASTAAKGPLSAPSSPAGSTSVSYATHLMCSSQLH